jgi:hypothetical protein
MPKIQNDATAPFKNIHTCTHASEVSLLRVILAAEK